MYAIINSGGKQHRVTPGETVQLDRLQAEPGEKFETDQVLLVQDDEGKVQVGQPIVKDVSVQGTIVDHVKGKKLIVFKRKRRKGYRNKNGHRQQYTQVAIEAINA